MKTRFFFIIIISIFFACNETATRNAIPINQLINELIIETIKQDSLDTSVPISNKIVAYHLVKSEVNSYIPFRDEKGEPFIFKVFSSRSKHFMGINIYSEDSISILNQITSAENIYLDTTKLKNIVQVEDFSKWSNEKYRETKSYTFLMPIFNHDKTIAWIEYDYHCPACGKGKMIVFKKNNKSWVKFSEYFTWIN